MQQDNTPQQDPPSPSASKSNTTSPGRANTDVPTTATPKPIASVDTLPRNSSSSSLESANIHSPTSRVATPPPGDTLKPSRHSLESQKSQSSICSPQLVEYPTSLLEYQIESLVAQGVHSKVYKAKFRQIPVAIKMINVDIALPVPPSAAYANSSQKNESITAFDATIKEYQALRRCKHPNVIELKSIFVHKETLCLVMEYFEGGSVRDILNQGRFSQGFKQDEDLLASILKQVLEGIRYCHKHDFLHRDLKASNILINKQGVCKITDFGFSREMLESGQKKKQITTFMGISHWMAPEVLSQSGGYNSAADIWSFGITALELANGEPMHSKSSNLKLYVKIVEREIDEQSFRGVSKSFRDMVMACIEKDPAKRPDADKLLNYSFFKKVKGPDYIKEHLIPLIPEKIGQILNEEEKQSFTFEDDEEDVDGWNFDREKPEDSVLPNNQPNVVVENRPPTSDTSRSGNSIEQRPQPTESKRSVPIPQSTNALPIDQSEQSHSAPVTPSQKVIDAATAAKEVLTSSSSASNLASLNPTNEQNLSPVRDPYAGQQKFSKNDVVEETRGTGKTIELKTRTSHPENTSTADGETQVVGRFEMRDVKEMSDVKQSKRPKTVGQPKKVGTKKKNGDPSSTGPSPASSEVRSTSEKSQEKTTTRFEVSDVNPNEVPGAQKKKKPPTIESLDRKLSTLVRRFDEQQGVLETIQDVVKKDHEMINQLFRQHGGVFDRIGDDRQKLLSNDSSYSLFSVLQDHDNRVQRKISQAQQLEEENARLKRQLEELKSIMNGTSTSGGTTNNTPPTGGRRTSSASNNANQQPSGS